MTLLSKEVLSQEHYPYYFTHALSAWGIKKRIHVILVDFQEFRDVCGSDPIQGPFVILATHTQEHREKRC